MPVEFRAKTAADVLALLNEQLDTLRQDASLRSVERAKAVRYLTGISLCCKHSLKRIQMLTADAKFGGSGIEFGVPTNPGGSLTRRVSVVICVARDICRTHCVTLDSSESIHNSVPTWVHRENGSR